MGFEHGEAIESVDLVRELPKRMQNGKISKESGDLKRR